MFENLEKKRIKISSQKKVDGVILKKKSGRPRAPEKGKYHFKIPIALHTEIKEKSKIIGCNISSFVCQAVKDKLDKL